jgi:hypothetical protein
VPVKKHSVDVSHERREARLVPTCVDRALNHRRVMTRALADRSNPMTASPLHDLRTLIDNIAVALMTTRPADGHLVSRPMALQKEAPGADLWFVTSREASVVEELRGIHT